MLSCTEATPMCFRVFPVPFTQGLNWNLCPETAMSWLKLYSQVEAQKDGTNFLVPHFSRETYIQMTQVGGTHARIYLVICSSRHCTEKGSPSLPYSSFSKPYFFLLPTQLAVWILVSAVGPVHSGHQLPGLHVWNTGCSSLLPLCLV